MKKNIMLVLAVLLSISALNAEDFHVPDYYPQSDFLVTTPTVSGNATGAFFNPAVWGLMKFPEVQYYWNDLAKYGEQDKNWTLIFGLDGIGFSIQHWDYIDLSSGYPEERKLNDYTIGMGGGDEESRFGIGYTWSKGDITSYSPRHNVLSAGMLERPNRYISYGLAGHWAMKKGNLRGVADVGIRPFGTPLFTLFGDATLRNDQNFKDVLWAAGASLEPLPGMALQAKYYQGGAFTAGVSISLGGLKASFMPHYDADSELTFSTYGVRLGFPENMLHKKAMKDKMMLKVDFTSQIKYQRFKLFDQGGHTLTELLHVLERVKTDPMIAGLAIRITEDMYSSPELVWEVREKINELKFEGKTIVVFFERGGWLQYYLASVADKIMVDPSTSISIMGFNFGRTYYRGLFDKLGIGVEEWRFFKYKSAFESLARKSMSDGDREQLQRLAEGFYDILREDICNSRGITHDEFDNVVNEVVFLDADSSIFYNLADTIGRWDEMEDYIEMVAGSKKSMIGMMPYAAIEPQSREWGEPPQIAIIYGLGPCAMNYGLNARRLRGVIKSARENERIKAVVFRADSPGGDILPSDIVADELKKTAEKKPVIVSQGMVAGSGGYWISMYGDKIIAAPWTITGSIGVIGGWFYNDGFGDEIGLTYDHTQVGKHADLTGGIDIPFIGRLPERNLDSTEYAGMEKRIKAWYQEFIEKVAKGRNMEEDAVHEVAQGRIWTGTDGLECGLVDEIGGMERAIEMAREAAGLKPDSRIKIVEMPAPGLMDLSKLGKIAMGLKWQAEYKQRYKAEEDYFRMLLEAEGKPLIVMPPEYYMQW